jgi:hypothetical protein
VATQPTPAIRRERTFTPTKPTKFNAEWVAEQTWKTLNDAINTFEHSATYAFDQFQKWSSFKGKNWFKNWHGWATKIIPHDLVHIAQTHSAALEKDFANWANGVANVVRHSSDWIPNSEELMRDTMRNISNAYNWVKDSTVMKTAREIATAGKNDILAKLNIPSQYELEDLQRKLATLEQRLTTVMLRGARNR